MTSKISCFAVALGITLGWSARAAADGEAREESRLDQLFASELGVTHGLTSAEVAARTTGTSPTLRERNQELLAAAADVDRALYAYLPTTTLSASYTRLSNTTGPGLGNIVSAPGVGAGPIPAGAQLVNVPAKFDTLLNQYSFQASLIVPVSDYFLRVAPSHSAARYGELAARHNAESSKQSVAADARVTYYGWVRARLSAIVAEQALAQARAHHEDAKVALAAGTASPADVLRVESQVARSENLLATSQTLVVLNEEQLRTLMHDSGSARYRIGEDIRLPFGAAEPAPFEALWHEASSNRPELKALDAVRAAREKNVTVERASYLPQLALFADGAYANPNSRVFPQADEFHGSWDVGAQLSFTISDIPATSARTRSAEADVQATLAQRAEVADQIRVEVASARKGVLDSRVSVQTTERGLAAAEESYRVRRLLFQNGRATSTELLDAETDLTSARLEALGSRIDERIAEVRLDYALGRPSGGRREGRGFVR